MLAINKVLSIPSHSFSLRVRLCRPLRRTALWALAIDETQPLHDLPSAWHRLSLCSSVHSKYLEEAIGDVDCCCWVTVLVHSARRAMNPPILIDQQRKRQIRFLFNSGSSLAGHIA